MSLPASSTPLEQALRNVATAGRMIARDDSREIWRFEHDGTPLDLHFYPRDGGKLRSVRGNPALRELAAFQQLQKAHVASPRALSALVGFRLGERVGDALLLRAITPAATLEDIFVNGDSDVDRRSILNQIIEIAKNLARAKLGHDGLELRNFLYSEGKVYLTNATAVRRGGLHLPHLERLAHSARPFVTRGELTRAWRELGPPGTRVPARNRINNKLWRQFIRGVHTG